ncbi:MAG TPA: hypothetical protein VEQ85_15700, partial [Lacipirellulaceae bacterium]|nr:hypothetical protein [Lacipirellulaceae bacterium]
MKSCQHSWRGPSGEAATEPGSLFSRPRESRGRAARHLVLQGWALGLVVAVMGSTGCTAFMAPRQPIPIAPPDPPPSSNVPRELEK